MFTMRIKSIHLFITITCLLFLLFTTCKKYPENNLWLKNPAKVIDGTWQLEVFEMNGNDSLNQNVDLISGNGVKFHLNSKKNKRGPISIPNQEISFGGAWALVDKEEKIRIYFVSNYGTYTDSLACVCYNFNNIFADYRQYIDWKINKLSKQQFWIETNYNNMKYEIHFKK